MLIILIIGFYFLFLLYFYLNCLFFGFIFYLISKILLNKPNTLSFFINKYKIDLLKNKNKFIFTILLIIMYTYFMVYFLGKEISQPDFNTKFIIYILFYSLILNLINCYFFNINFFSKYNFRMFLILLFFILTYKIFIYILFIPFINFIFKQDLILLEPYPNQQVILDETTPFDTLWNTMVNSIYNNQIFITDRIRDHHIIIKYKQIPSLKFTPNMIEEGLKKGYSNEVIHENMYNYLASIRGQKRGYLVNYTSAVACLSYLDKYGDKSLLASSMQKNDINRIEFTLKLFGWNNYKLNEREVTINDMITVFTAARNDFKFWANNYSDVTNSNSQVLKQLHPYEYDWRLEDGYKKVKENSIEKMIKTDLYSYYNKFEQDFNKEKTNAYK